MTTPRELFGLMTSPARCSKSKPSSPDEMIGLKLLVTMRHDLRVATRQKRWPGPIDRDSNHVTRLNQAISSRSPRIFGNRSATFSVRGMRLFSLK